MNQTDIALIESSFERIREHQETITLKFYNALFDEYPELKPLFQRMTVEQQARKLYQAIAMVVQNIRYEKLLHFSLRELGKRHTEQYGVLLEHYSVFKVVIGKTFAETFGDDWTPELAAAWSAAFDNVVTLMLDKVDEHSNANDS